ncbi:fumarylacetoacetate hydrolase family protein [Acuticoccus kandeliae]|uniref:fumarylacetoacetate hydrolase family protein n=1 Tax=Acuticoccus kandeliae TaxID=2073160 RepID=UPI000D3E79CB|nr:fumarylacetoacetate hydrolase family protein [Acuticoccus kandeliae]
MRYVMFSSEAGARVGALVGEDTVVDLTAALPAVRTMRDVIAGGDVLQSEIEAAIAGASGRPLGAVDLLSPLPDPGKVICLGLNYADHAKEGGNELPGYPALFMRGATSLIGPGAPMIVPTASDKLDYEAELAIVIGTECRHVMEEEAGAVIFGYTIFNDGSVRDYQRRSTQWTAGKNFDGTGAVGPWIVTADELPAGAAGIGIRSRLNGAIMQNSNTAHMIFSVPRTIAILSEVMTLQPGDLIATGTPEGVGYARKPPVFLRPGDEIAIEIDGIGTLTNPVAAERAPA